MKVEKVHSVKQLPVEVYSTALLIGEAVIEVEKIIQPLIKFHAPSSTWELILRIGITTGPALHGLLKTDSLINADVVGALVFLFYFQLIMFTIPGESGFKVPNSWQNLQD